MENLKIIKDLFKDTPDLIIRPIKKRFNTVYIIFLETVSSGDRVNSYILNPLTLPSKNKLSIEKALSGPNLKVIDINDVEKYLCSGFTIILDKQTIYAVETKAELDRGIDEAKVEPAIYGPKDSLVENINKNIGLIKRRIKSSHLKIKDHTLGRYSKIGRASCRERV